MTTIGYDSIENILLSISDPNTWGAMTQVPWVSSPKINAWTSIYNEQWGWSWIAGWSTNVSWSSSDYNTVAWSSWDINLPDWTTLTVTSWNTGNMSSTTYIYYDRSDDTVKTTTVSADSVWEDKILICVANPTTSWKDAEFQAFGTNAQSTFIYADNIAANTITGNEIQANSIGAYQIEWYSITANKLNVDELSAISANLWYITAWDIKGTTITAGNTSSSAVRMYPSWSSWYLQFYYSWSTVWTIQWQYVSWVGNTVAISGTNIAMNWKVYCLDRLKIPVWTNKY